MKINKISELDGVKIDGYRFTLVEEDGVLKVENKKDSIEITLKINEDKRYSIVEKIKKYTGINITLENLDSRETLRFIEGKGFNKTIWNKIGKATHKYNMIEEGDKIAVGISGGKDSLTLLNALVRIKKIASIDFEILPIHIHPKEEGESYKEVEAYCRSLGVELDVYHTELEEILFKEGEEVKNPCFLCGRIRRGILYRLMKERGINKLALGHHKDDIIETFLMNVFYQGNLSTMKPSYRSSKYGVDVIRPLAFVEEKDIIRYTKRLKLPILKSECPYEESEDSRRLKMKNLIKKLEEDSKEIRSVILKGVESLL